MLKNEVLEHLEVRLAAKEHPPITEGLHLIVTGQLWVGKVEL